MSRAMLRFTGKKNGVSTEFTFDCDQQACGLFSGGVREPLQPRSLEVLRVLIANWGDTISRADLIEAVWPMELNITDQNLETHVSVIRRTIGHQCINTISKTGYQFVARATPEVLRMAKALRLSRPSRILRSSVPRATNFDDLIGEIKSQIIQDVSGALSISSLTELADATKSIDAVLVGSLNSALLNYSPQAIPGCGPPTGGLKHVLSISGLAYKLTVAEGADSALVQIALAPYGPGHSPRTKRESKTFSLSGVGRYESVNIVVPEVAAPSIEWFGAASQATFSSGYKWIEEGLYQLLGHPVLSASREIYSLLRVLFADSKLESSIWLVCACEDRVFYLLDAGPASAAIESLSHYTTRLGASAIRSATEFFAFDLPRSETYMNSIDQSRLEGESADINLAVRTSTETDLLLGAEEVIYGGALVVTFFVISKHEKISLHATYPASKQEHITKVLRANRRMLSERFARVSSLVQSAVRFRQSDPVGSKNSSGASPNVR